MQLQCTTESTDQGPYALLAQSAGWSLLGSPRAELERVPPIEGCLFLYRVDAKIIDTDPRVEALEFAESTINHLTFWLEPKIEP